MSCWHRVSEVSSVVYQVHIGDNIGRSKSDPDPSVFTFLIRGTPLSLPKQHRSVGDSSNQMNELSSMDGLDWAGLEC